MSARDDEVNQNANRNSNEGGGRRSSQGPYRSSYDNTENYYPGRPDPHAEQEKLLICVTLFTIWLLMITAGFFLLYYVYVLEWDPVMSDSVSVFGLTLAVIILYITFVIDICVGILILISRQDYVKPHNARIFWIAILILVINLVHGIFIWLWVWTGEYPRTCAKNTFYYGKHCVDVEMIMIANTNSDQTLSLGTCKCDYGQCLPECKGLREVQNYFWLTYWLCFLRLVVLIMLLRPLRQAFCECHWCCCKDSQTWADGRPRRVSQAPYTPDADSGPYSKEGYNSSGKILPLSESNNNNSTFTGVDKSMMNSADIGTRSSGYGNSKAATSGYDSVRARAANQSEMSNGFNDHNRYSEDGTFTGTTIMETGEGQDKGSKRPPNQSKLSLGFAEYNRNSMDGTYTGTTIKGTGDGQDSGCLRAKEPIKVTYGSECTRGTSEPSKMTNGFADREYKRNSEDGTFTGTTIKGTGAGQDPGCTRPPKQSKMTYGFTEYKRNSEDGTFTGTTIRGIGAGKDPGCTRATTEPSKLTNGFTEYKRKSEDGTFTGTTIRGIAAGKDSGCTRATTEPSKMTNGFTAYKRNSEDGTFTGTTIRETGAGKDAGCTRAKDSRKMSFGSSEYKRNSKDGTFTGTTIRGTAVSLDSGCTRTTYQSGSSAYTDYTRDSEDYTGTTIKGTGAGCERESINKMTKGKESVKTGDGCDTVVTIVPNREMIYSRPQDSAGKKEPVGKVNQGTGESMTVQRGT